MKNDLLGKVKDYVIKNNLICMNDKIVLGVSGGADSMCLLLVLSKLKLDFNLSLTVVHVNHMLRKMDADLDEQFVINYCKNFQVPYFVVKEDVNRISKEEKLSLEEAGRKVRYDAFNEVSRKVGANKIAVAHNMDDQAETMLFRMFRGTSIKGLALMQGNISIIRPLLNVRRYEIEEYLLQNNVDFRQDETNFSLDYSRNVIRNKILPVAKEQINEKSIENLYELACKCTSIYDFIEETVKVAYKQVVVVNNKKEQNSEEKPWISNSAIDKKASGQEQFANNNYEDILCEDGKVESLAINISELLKLHPYIQSELILYSIPEVTKKKKDITNKHIESVLSLAKNQSGRSVDLPYDMVATRSFDFIILSKNSEDLIDKSLTKENELMLPITVKEIGDYQVIELEKSNEILEIELLEYKKNNIFPKNKYTKWFDYDKINGIMHVRCRMEGDYVQIKDGKKLLKKVFSDNKIPISERDKLPLLAFNNHIIWAIGLRESEAFRIDENTKRVLALKVRTR